MNDKPKEGKADNCPNCHSDRTMLDKRVTAYYCQNCSYRWGLEAQMKFYFVQIADSHFIHATNIQDDNRDAIIAEIIEGLRGRQEFLTSYPTVRLTPLNNAAPFTAAIRFELGDLSIF